MNAPNLDSVLEQANAPVAPPPARRLVPNTVYDMPESVFRARWISLLWQAMTKRAKGYRMWTLKNQPPAGAAHWRGERRGDKREGPLAGMPKAFRSYHSRYASPAVRLTEKSARRQKNLMAPR